MQICYKEEKNPCVKIPELREYLLHSGEKVPVLKFPELEKIEGVEHCFSTRLGGVSRGIFYSMNLSFTRGDDPDAVLENYARIAETMGTEVNRIVCSDQTHTNNVRLVTEADCGKGVVRPRDYQDIDGMITDTPGICLATFYADCVPLYIVDPVRKAIGLSHSGWRGTVGRIGEKTVLAMREKFGTDPKDVRVAIGPSICSDCYEIGSDVAEKFTEEFATAGFGDGSGYPIVREKKPENGEGKFLLNLWEANRRVFLDAGVRAGNIEITNLCTCCNPDVLFSHRASKGKRGNMGAFLMLK